MKIGDEVYFLVSNQITCFPDPDGPITWGAPGNIKRVVSFDDHTVVLVTHTTFASTITFHPRADVFYSYEEVKAEAERRNVASGAREDQIMGGTVPHEDDG